MSDSQYITFEDLKIILEQFSETLMKGEEKLEDARLHAFEMIKNLFSQKIEELNYHRLRDLHFIMNVLSSVGYGPMDRLEEYYNTYCAEFDKLNKQETKDDRVCDCKD